MRVDLPAGGWAELREPSDLITEDEVAVRDAVPMRVGQDEAARARGGEPAAATTMTTALTTLMEIAMLGQVVTSWSRPEPVSEHAIRALPLSWFRPLKKAIAPHMAELRDDPNSPGGP